MDVPLSVVLLPAQMVTSGPASAVRLPVVITTSSVEEQVPFDTVTVYVVVAAGVATGFAMLALLRPVEGLQL